MTALGILIAALALGAILPLALGAVAGRVLRVRVVESRAIASSAERKAA